MKRRASVIVQGSRRKLITPPRRAARPSHPRHVLSQPGASAGRALVHRVLVIPEWVAEGVAAHIALAGTDETVGLRTVVVLVAHVVLVVHHSSSARRVPLTPIASRHRAASA